MYRVRSTDVWYNAPGVVAAYQPIAAPDSLAARQNIGGDLRMAGRHTAKPGVAPAWSSAAGWTFNGSTQWLDTGIIPESNQRWSIIVRFANRTNEACPTRTVDSAATTSRIGWYLDNSNVYHYHGTTPGGSKTVAPAMTTGVLGIAGAQGYRNGIADGTTMTGFSGTIDQTLPIGASRAFSGVSLLFAGTICAFAIASFIWTPAAVWQYSRQMAYCHVNPDWSAWSRRRRYYYAPSAILAAMRRRMPGEVRVGSRGVIE